VIDDNVFVEIVPYLNQPDVFQIYVTTRDREAMPLLRYHTGDIVRRMQTGYRLLGREGGLYFRPDGTLVSPTEIDDALPADFSCWHYSLVQTSENRWDFHYVSDHIAPKSVEAAVAGALGPGARVVAFRRRFIAPAASGKFALLKPLAK
jgi:phenylacetate-CoA ligase